MMTHTLNRGCLAALVAALLAGAASSSSAASGPCVESTVAQALATTGADPDANARARFRLRADCGQDFAVEVEDLPVGNYDLVVGGVLRGVIAVIDTGAGIQGQIEFEAADDTPHPLELDFDPLGALIEIRGGGTTFFSDELDGVSPTPGAGASPSPTRTPGEVAATQTAAPTEIAATQTPRATGSAATRTRTPSSTRTATRARTSTAVPTQTRTRIPTALRTSTPARTATVARTATPIRTRTATRVRTATRTRTATRVRTATRTRTAPRVGTATPTRAATQQATPSAVQTTTATAAASPLLQVTCERRANRSRISVNASNIAGGSYRAVVVSGANSATSLIMATVGDEIEFDFDSDPGDVAQGARQIAATFIGTPAEVTATLETASGVFVLTTTAGCAVL